MLRQLDAHELREWIAFERIEPFTAERIDYGFTRLECVIRSALGEKGVNLKDHLPVLLKDGGGAPQKQTPAQIGAAFETIRRTMAEAERGKKH